MIIATILAAWIAVSVPVSLAVARVMGRLNTIGRAQG